jgi:hypothetical protein
MSFYVIRCQASTHIALACSSPPQLEPIFQVVFTIIGRGRLYEYGLAGGLAEY